MDLNEYRQQRQPVECRLPSTLEVKLRPVSLEALVMSGRLPLALLSDLGEQSQNGQVEFDTTELLARAAEFGPMIDAFADACLAAVQIGEDYLPPEQIEPPFVASVELDMQDKIAILTWGTGGVDRLKTFRDGTTEPGAAGDSAPDRNGLQLAPVSPGGDLGPAGSA